jgi:hypothetical protein
VPFGKHKRCWQELLLASSQCMAFREWLAVQFATHVQVWLHNDRLRIVDTSCVNDKSHTGLCVYIPQPSSVKLPRGEELPA